MTSLTHLISGEELWATERKITPVIRSALAEGYIDAHQFYLDDLAAQIEVSRVREIADRLSIYYISSDWQRTYDGDVEVLFTGLENPNHLNRLKRTLRTLARKRG
jgi:hypothetical protein